MTDHPVADPERDAMYARDAELQDRELAVEEAPALNPRPSAGSSSTAMSGRTEPSCRAGAADSDIVGGPTLTQQAALIPSFLRAHADILEQLGLDRQRLAVLRAAWDLERELRYLGAL